MELTERQINLLKAIVEEHMETGEPVGSLGLSEKYKLGCSSATIRNEMANLVEHGLLGQPHTSAGRLPTTIGIRYYLTVLMEEEEVPVLQEVAIKQRLWQEREAFDRLLRQAALALADATRLLAVITTHNGHVFSAGQVNILEHSEFFDIDVTRALLNLLDHHDLMHEVFEKASSEEALRVLVGEELGMPNLEPCGTVFSSYKAGKHTGVVAVFGPARMPYPKIIPAIRYLKGLLEEVGGGW